tara:strand:+ start:1177 stop:1341 length:165 start_codon:yes stop_codon:yes gene_type:complete
MTEDVLITPIAVMIAISIMAIGFVMGLRNKRGNLKFRLTDREKDKIEPNRDPSE